MHKHPQNGNAAILQWYHICRVCNDSICNVHYLAVRLNIAKTMLHCRWQLVNIHAYNVYFYHLETYLIRQLPCAHARSLARLQITFYRLKCWTSPDKVLSVWTVEFGEKLFKTVDHSWTAVATFFCVAITLGRLQN